MINNKQTILQIMKNINFSADIIEEYEEGNILPYERETIKIVSIVIKKLKGIDEKIELPIYDEDDLKKIDKLYDELYSRNLI